MGDDRMTAKRISLLVTSCRNCVFCTSERKPKCMYAFAFVNGTPMDIRNPNQIHEDCPLVDATEQDMIPAPIYYKMEKDGTMNLVIDTD